MIPPTPAVSSRFTWHRLPWSRGYQLNSRGEMVATLRRPSVWSSTFVATTSATEWMFRRGGCWGRRAEILDSASKTPIASFTEAWSNRGKLVFSDGQAFTFECRGLWHPTWTIRSDDGKPVLTLSTREKAVELATHSLVEEERLQLLILFTLYRRLQAEEDASVAVMVTACS